MVNIGYEPGYWPVSYAGIDTSVFGAGDDADDESGLPDQTQFEQLAIGLLWNWTGRVFGTRSYTVRPCRTIKPEVDAPSTFEGSGPWPINPGFGSGHSTIGFNVGTWMPVLVNGAWFNIRCGSCGGINCSCEPNRIRSIVLPDPTVGVQQVIVDGEVLDPSAYRLEERKWLIRSDGGRWPVEQNLDLPTSEAGTWSVTFAHGVEVPVGGQIAAGVLAVELAKASVGDEDCQLPNRISSITREGLSLQIMDPFTNTRGMTRSSAEIPKITTGIWLIDSWTAAATNPRAYASVRSVDSAGTSRWRY